MPPASSEQTPGRVLSLHRYPVKSLGGEGLERATFDLRGLAGDRFWSVRDEDGKLGSGKSSRRFRRMEGLLSLLARYDGDVPVIDFGGGRELRGDDPGIHEALSAYVGRPVRLSAEEVVPHFDDGPVHLLTTASLSGVHRGVGELVDVRRFRPNLVIETPDGPDFPENAWVGRRLAIGGEVVLEVTAPMPRCVMVTLAQRGLPDDPRVLRAVTAANEADLGVVADVVAAGVVTLGDELRLLD